MTSILAAQPIDFPIKNIMTQLDTSAIAQINDRGLQRRPKMEPAGNKNRGRRRSGISRSKESVEDASPIEGDAEGENVDGHSSGTDGGPSRKRRRSRKGLDKKFECPQEGCGKSYSRAEHL